MACGASRACSEGRSTSNEETGLSQTNRDCSCVEAAETGNQSRRREADARGIGQSAWLRTSYSHPTGCPDGCQRAFWTLTGKLVILQVYIFILRLMRRMSPSWVSAGAHGGIPPLTQRLFLFGHISTVASTFPSSGLMICSIPLRAGSLLNNTAYSSSYLLSRIFVSPLLRS